LQQLFVAASCKSALPMLDVVVALLVQQGLLACVGLTHSFLDDTASRRKVFADATNVLQTLLL